MNCNSHENYYRDYIKVVPQIPTKIEQLCKVSQEAAPFFEGQKFSEHQTLVDRRGRLIQAM